MQALLFKISAIVAMTEEKVIGFNQALPWRLPSDLRRFRKLTTGHCMLMGRKTFESIGRVLPDRTSLVLSRQPSFPQAPGLMAVPSLEAALDFMKKKPIRERQDELFVIGGAQIYNLTKHLWDRIYLTRLRQNFTGDTFFPSFKDEDYQCVFSESGPASELPYEFSILERIKS